MLRKKYTILERFGKKLEEIRENIWESLEKNLYIFDKFYRTTKNICHHSVNKITPTRYRDSRTHFGLQTQSLVM